MSDPFDLPERELPEHVRRAALRRIMTEINHEPSRRKPGLAPLLIAASVVILMAGATIVATSVLGNNDHKVSTAGPHSATHTTSPSGSAENGFGLYKAQRDWGTGAEMGRCAEADNRGDSTWVPLLRVERGTLVALLYRVANDLVFCQLTPKTITAKSVPYPAPPAGGMPARIMFVTAEGTFAGVTAPAVDNLVINGTSSPVGEPAAIGNGVFILPRSFKRTDTVTLRGFNGADKHTDDVPQPLPTSRRSDDPRGDRTSDAGKRLGGCLSAADPPIPDADWFAPGASVVVDAQHWGQLGVLGNELLWCSSDPDHPYFYLPISPTTHAVQWAPVVKFSPPSIGATIAGIALNAAAATVTVQPPDMEAHTATVVNRTFIVTGTGEPVSGTTVTVKDSSGKVID